MKKILIAVVLVLAMALSLTLAACSSPVTKIEVKEGTLSHTYNVGDTIKYDKAFLVVTYEDGTTKDVKFTDSGVKYNTISTATAGDYTLTVTYKGKTATFDITIEGGAVANVTVETFKIPVGYSDYLERAGDTSGGENSFSRSGEMYKVGSVNKFEFSPIAEYFDDYDRLQTISDVATTMKLYKKDGATYEVLTADQAATYVTKTGNMYKFNTVANGESFKMEVSLDETTYEVADTLDETTLTVEFQVVDAYNAYDMLGLSVYDNLNVKHWAEIKNRTLRWDDKKLSEYTDVKEVVLHADIDINPDNLPATYFWTTSTQIKVGRGDKETTKGYTEAQPYVDDCSAFQGQSIVGTLIDGVGDGNTYRMANHNADLVEGYSIFTIQKALYYTNQCNVSGNYMTIKTIEAETSGRKLISYVSDDVNAKNNPKSHWAILGTVKTAQGDPVSLSVENLQITGNMGMKSNTSGEPAGLMGMVGGIENMTLTNVNIYTCFTQFTTISNGAYIAADAQTTLNLTDCKFEQAYSNMVYGYRTGINIVRSSIKDAGGPLFILVDGSERTTANYDEGGKCTLTVDDASTLEAYANGDESWYQAYGVGKLFMQIKAMDALLKGYCHVTILRDKAGAGSDTVKLLNVVAVMIPDPGDLEKSATQAADRVWIKGDFKLLRESGANELYSMEDAIYNGIKFQNRILFKSGNAYADMSGENSLADPTNQSFAGWANHSDYLCLYMNVGAGKGGLYPYFGVIIGGVETVSA